MGLLLLLETVAHLKPIQWVYLALYKVYRPQWTPKKAPLIHRLTHITYPIAKNFCFDGTVFSYLNVADQFRGWNLTEHGMLWAYNLNYMDWLGQNEISVAECERWIDSFIKTLPQNRIGLAPYPIALRAINWIKFFSQHPECRSAERNDALYSQIRLLRKRLEYRLLGNHLLEDAYALFIASIYFNDEKMYNAASKLLKKQLNEQVLKDGAHFEQSPMYHCILLDRLLDCYNISMNNVFFERQKETTSLLKEKAEMMLGHLKALVYENGCIPLLNDSAYGIAPTVDSIFDYASRLGLSWKELPMNECGYRKMKKGRIETIIDIGSITATYQPGHSHADMFNFELRIDGIPFIVDTGISTYEKTSRRQYERSTAAHNTVVIDGKDSCRVWGGFRVGRRAFVNMIRCDKDFISASHDGFGRKKLHQRYWTIKNDDLIVNDVISSNRLAKNYIHFDSNILIESFDNHCIKTSLGLVLINNACQVNIEKCQISSEYNRLRSSFVAVLSFRKEMSYRICAN